MSGPITTVLIPGDPVPWQRARTNGKRHFKAPQVVEYEQRCQNAWLVEGKPSFGDRDVTVSARFVFARKPSHLKVDGTPRKGAPVRPRCDIDNLTKGLLDSLNGLLFADDSQVVCLSGVSKRYAVAREEPHTELQVWEAPHPDSLRSNP